MPSPSLPWLARHFVTAFVTAASTFLLLDTLWLSAMAAPLYRPAVGHLLRGDFDVVVTG